MTTDRIVLFWQASAWFLAYHGRVGLSTEGTRPLQASAVLFLTSERAFFIADAGIRLCAGVQGSADEAARALAQGQLAYYPNARCDHHGHHGEGHECVHHHGEGHECGHEEGDEGCRRHHEGQGHCVDHPCHGN